MKLGIIGGGQLARMLALAGHPLGVRCVVLDPAADACARDVAEHIRADFDNVEALQRLADQVDCVTYEFESVPGDALRHLASRCPVHPAPDALVTGRDRLLEKNLFTQLSIPTPRYHAAGSAAELRAALVDIGVPAVVKTRTLGYDGKGQAIARSVADAEAIWRQLGAVPLIVEAFVNFRREVSILAVRSRSGTIGYHSLSENSHRDGILRLSRQCACDPLQGQAEQAVASLLRHFDYVGVLALELFEVQGQLLANELAPRVHNSGHWTIEGAQTSQFENHVRAVLDLPLGDTAAIGYSAMVNFIGAIPPAQEVLAIPGCHLHDYGKQPRPLRKVGHATVRAAEPAALSAAIARLAQLAEAVE